MTFSRMVTAMNGSKKLASRMRMASLRGKWYGRSTNSDVLWYTRPSAPPLPRIIFAGGLLLRPSSPGTPRGVGVGVPCSSCDGPPRSTGAPWEGTI